MPYKKALATREKHDAAAVTIQSHVRSFLARKHYGVKQLPENQRASYSTFIIGNDPIVSGLERYASCKGKLALIGTSGLRSLSLACQLGNKAEVPKLIIVDNSKEVVAFWRKLRADVERFDLAKGKEAFITLYKNFLYLNDNLYRHLPDEIMTELSENSSTLYLNQNPINYMKDLIEQHSLKGVPEQVYLSTEHDAGAMRAKLFANSGASYVIKQVPASTVFNLQLLSLVDNDFDDEDTGFDVQSTFLLRLRRSSR